MADMDLKFTGNATDAERAIAKLERKHADLENKIGQVSRRSKQGAGGVGQDLAKWANSLTGVAAGYVALPALIGKVVAANREFVAQADQAADKYDNLFIKFRIQAGLTGLAAEKAKQSILAIAERNAFTEENANAAAVQLVSSGFSPEDATGGALNVTLQALAASGRGTEDPTQLVQASGQFLAAQGLEKNAANLERVLVAVQRLFKGTDLQLGDLSQLAGKSQGFRGRMTPEETLGVFDILREKSGADTASTAEKIIVERLTTAAEDKQRVDTLERLGLTPQEVDLVGESIGQVLDKLAKGFDALPEEQRAGVASKMFGQEAVSPFMGLMADRGKLPGVIAMMQDQAGFAEDVNIATSGRAAAQRRSELRTRRIMSDQASDFELYLAAAFRDAVESGIAPGLIRVKETAARTAFEMGADPKTAVTTGFARLGKTDLTDVFAEAELAKQGATPNLRPVVPDIPREVSPDQALEQAAASARQLGLDLSEPPQPPVTASAPGEAGGIPATAEPQEAASPSDTPRVDVTVGDVGKSRSTDAGSADLAANISRLATALEENTRVTAENTKGAIPHPGVGRPPQINRRAHSE